MKEKISQNNFGRYHFIISLFNLILLFNLSILVYFKLFFSNFMTALAKTLFFGFLFLMNEQESILFKYQRCLFVTTEISNGDSNAHSGYGYT